MSCEKLEQITICVRQGSTFGGRDFTFTDGAQQPIQIEEAFCVVKDRRQVVVHDFAPTITGASLNVVRLGAMSEDVTRALPDGTHYGDLQVHRADGVTRTYLALILVVEKAISQPPSS